MRYNSITKLEQKQSKQVSALEKVLAESRKELKNSKKELTNCKKLLTREQRNGEKISQYKIENKDLLEKIQELESQKKKANHRISGRTIYRET
jgi:hemoglobin-like flavoprotein